MKRVFKTLTAVLMALTLVVGMSATAKADNVPTSPEVAITKQLNIAKGVTTPTATFTFKFAQNTTLEGVESTAVALADKSISYTAADEDVNGDKMIVKDTGNILAGVTFPHAGVFAYDVTEQSNTYAVQAGETMTYSDASYVLRIYVKNSGNGPTVEYVTVDKEGEGKVDGGTTTGTITKPGDPGKTESTGNGFRFINTFDKTAGTDTDGDGKYESLTISNAVSGTYASEKKDFTYKLTLSGNEEYDCTIAGVAGTITGGTEKEFTLKHGESFVLLNAPAGLTYTLVQSGEEDYTPSVAILENGVSGTANEGEGEALTLTDKLIGEKANSAAFTNTYDDASVTPTGIIINNLPFVMMILVAVLCIAMIMASKRRRA